jgi:hypothetical protein
MKMYWSLILLALINSGTVLGQFAEFSFDQKVHKFDEVTEGAVLECDFPFVNSGDVPLIISNHKVECSCTQVTYPSTPILPGDSAIVHVRFDSNGKLGWQYRPIQLYANTKKNPSKIEIRVKVNSKE